MNNNGYSAGVNHDNGNGGITPGSGGNRNVAAQTGLAILLHWGRCRTTLGQSKVYAGHRPHLAYRLCGEERFVDALLQELNPRRPDARQFALSHRVLLAKTRNGVEVDVALGALPFEERTIARASPWQLRQGVSLLTCSAEDLVVHKAFAGRDLDWADVERILIRQHGKLDLVQVRMELRPLLELKGEMQALDKLELKITTVERRLRAKL